jgi:hypothetical protein
MWMMEYEMVKLRSLEAFLFEKHVASFVTHFHPVLQIYKVTQRTRHTSTDNK